MKLEFEKTVCRCMKRVLWETQNWEQTQELRLPEDMPDAGRVLCAWGQPVLRSKEWMGDEIGASGGVMVWVLCQPEDGSFPRAVQTWVPFQGRFRLPATDREGKILLKLQLRSADARTLSARKLMVRVCVGVLAEVLCPAEVALSLPGEMPEGVELLENTYPMLLPKTAGEKTFVLDEELTLPEGCTGMGQVLYMNLLPQLLESRVMAGKVVFRGNGLLHMLYRKESGEIAAWDCELPFSQFGELEEEIGPEAGVELHIAVTGLEPEAGEQGTLHLKCSLVAQYAVSEQRMIRSAEDAYALNREVEGQFDSLFLPAELDCRSLTVDSGIKTDADCVRVLDAALLLEHPQLTRTGDTVTAEVAGTYQLLYEDPEGKLQSLQRRWEHHWPLEAGTESLLTVSAQASAVPDAGMEMGKLCAGCPVVLTARTESGREMKQLTALTVGEAQAADPARPSLILRRAEGESLWDMAKSCRSTVAAIRQANRLEQEPEMGRLLLIPVP